MSELVSFENFRPLIRTGRAIPRGSRLIYESEDGRRQIILPIEMADVILLANGSLTMRQIIERVYRHRGHLHFRTIFTTIHQLRDHGFFENGEELESHSWWSKTKPSKNRITWTLFEFGRGGWQQARPMHFYFFGLLTIALSVLSLIDFPWPPIQTRTFSVLSTGWINLFLLFLLNSAFLTDKALLKLLFQRLLTGNTFGAQVRIAPWGIYMTATDEPIFLITNRLFLCLYHLNIILLPFALVATMPWWAPEWFPLAASLAILHLSYDLSPFSNSELRGTVGALLSIRQGDLALGYLRRNSLLSLLSPAGRPSLNLRLKRYFTLYLWCWSGFTLWLAALGCRALTTIFHHGPAWAVLGWSASALWGGRIFWHLFLHVRDAWVKPMWPGFKLYFQRMRRRKSTAWSQEQLLETLLNLPLFSYFSTSLLEKILSASEIVKVLPGSRLITQGELGLHLFVLLDGSLIAERSSFSEGRQRLGVLRPVSIFGEMAIVEEGEREADVIARESSLVLKVPAGLLKKTADESQYVREIEAFRNAVVVNQFFSSAPMFRDLPADLIENITVRSVLRQFNASDLIVKQGELGRSFFMLMRGSIKVEIDGKVIKTIPQGGFFGEISLIADIPRTATIRAAEPVMVLEMAASSFWEVLCQNVELAMFIESVGESRLAEDLQANLNWPMGQSA